MINKRQRAPQHFEAAPFWCALGDRARKWTLLSLCWASFQQTDQLQNDITPAPARPKVRKLWQVSGEIKTAFQMKIACMAFPGWYCRGKPNTQHRHTLGTLNHQPFLPGCCCVVPTKCPPPKPLPVIRMICLLFSDQSVQLMKSRMLKIKAMSLYLVYQGRGGLQASGIFCKWETIA